VGQYVKRKTAMITVWLKLARNTPGPKSLVLVVDMSRICCFQCCEYTLDALKQDKDSGQN